MFQGATHPEHGTAYLATFLLESRFIGLHKTKANRKIMSDRQEDGRKQEKVTEIWG